MLELLRFHGLEDGGVGAVEADLVVEVGGGEGEEEARPVDQDGPRPRLEGDHLRDLVGPLERRHIVPASIAIQGISKRRFPGCVIVR